MYNTKPSHLIHQRHSCRTYQRFPLSDPDLSALKTFANRYAVGPFGHQSRFRVLPASDYDPGTLPRLGTYGFIKNPAAFILGAISNQSGALEDFGYSMELLVLKATDLGIGSCWLGGTFTKSRFARQMDLLPDELFPAVTALGYPSNQISWLDRTVRIFAGADHRLPWDRLFFSNTWEEPLPENQAGDYLLPLQLLRLGPSASNKQPWRVLKESVNWHFFLERNPNYPPPVFGQLLDVADLQRIDMGIAMAHFQLGLEEAGLEGKWISISQDIDTQGTDREYIISWQPNQR